MHDRKSFLTPKSDLVAIFPELGQVNLLTGFLFCACKDNLSSREPPIKAKI